MHRRSAVFAAVLVALAVVGCQSADAGRFEATFFVEGEHAAASGDELQGLVALLGGRLEVEVGATVDGSIYMLGGDAVIAGDVRGDVSILGGRITLAPSARVDRLYIGGGKVERQPGAEVGEVVEAQTSQRIPLSLASADAAAGHPWGWLLARTLGLVLMAAVVSRLRPDQLGWIAAAASGHPFASGAYGLLMGIVAPALLVVMAFTLVLIPVAMLGLVLLVLIAALGLIGLGAGLGAWIAARRGITWSPVVEAVVGTAALSLLLEAVATAPVIGGIAPLAVVAVGLGAVLLTLFGREPFVPATERVLGPASVPPPSLPSDR